MWLEKVWELQEDYIFYMTNCVASGLICQKKQLYKKERCWNIVENDKTNILNLAGYMV